MTTDSTVLEKKKITSKKIKAPPKYKVVICNDDVTPVEFVIALLMRVFNYNENDALQLTLEIHNIGGAVAGVFTYEIAEQKSIDSMTMARNHGYPLVTKIEEA